MKKVSEYFGCNVFNDSVMQERLSEDVYRQLQRTVKLGKHLALGLANSVAAAMLEHKYEGLVLGSGCNSFKLAGAVVVFGTVSAWAAAAAAWLLGPA